jgi:hypothetical protein
VIWRQGFILWYRVSMPDVLQCLMRQGAGRKMVGEGNLRSKQDEQKFFSNFSSQEYEYM